MTPREWTEAGSGESLHGVGGNLSPDGQPGLESTFLPPRPMAKEASPRQPRLAQSHALLPPTHLKEDSPPSTSFLSRRL